MKLSKSVGKGCYCSCTDDVQVVQTALANIKQGSKPFYQGKIDGKDGAKTEKAIADFQCCNGIKANSKVESYGPTINKLRQKCPCSVKNKLGTANQSSLQNPALQRQLNEFKQKSRQIAADMKKHAPIPETEAVALASFIEKAGAQGVLLSVKDILPSSDGRVLVDSEVVALTTAPGFTNDSADKILRQISSTNSKWTYEVSSGLLRSNWSSAIIKGKASPTSEMMKVAGITRGSFRFNVSYYYFGGLERIIKANIAADTVNPEAEQEILKLLSRESDQVRAKFGGNRSTLLEPTLTAIEGASVAWARQIVDSSQIRTWYQRGIQAESRRWMNMAKQGKIGWVDAEFRAHKARGKVLQEARDMGAAFGRSLAEKLKKGNRTLASLQLKYLAEHFGGKALHELTSQERTRLAEIVIGAAGRDSASASARANVLGKIGKGLWILSFATAAYAIYEAENKVEETGRQGAILGGGILGGAAAGAAAGLACGPGAPICVGAGVLIGGILGAFGAEYLYDKAIED